MKNFVIKILVVVMTLSFALPFYSIKPAQAQFYNVVEFGPAASSLISSIVTATAVTAASSGTIGVGTANVNTIRATMGPCLATINALELVGDTVTTTATSTTSAALDVIGGGVTQFGTVSAKLVKATAAKTCTDQYVLRLNAAPGLTSNQSLELTREQDRYTKISASLRTEIDSLNAQQHASIQDILKAFMVKVILNVSKNLTTELVNKMVSKYKISDYLAYGDALASQVYSMKYINDNFSGDARQQMMIRSILQSEKLPGQIATAQAFANSKAQEYLGTACNVATQGINSSDANYFTKCLAAYGAPEANPQYQLLVAQDQATAAKAAGQTSANAEVAQSNGYAPPRNCQGSVASQNQIDTQYKTAADNLNIAQASLSRLQAAFKLTPPQTTQAEIDKAQAAVDQATANLNVLTKNVTFDNNGKTTNSPIIDICEAIDSPASFVANSIGTFLQKQLVSDTDLKTDNLPFYATFLSEVTSNFLTNILTGGKSTSQVLKEAGVGALNGAIIGVTGQAGTSTGTTGGTGTIPNPIGSVNISATVAGNRAGTPTTALTPNTNYTLTIDFSNIVDENPYRVVISGLGVAGGTNNLTLSPSDLAAKKISFDFTATSTPFNLSATFFVHPPSGTTGDVPIGPYTQTFTITGAVAGASIVLPRGPMPSFR